jgi:acyl-CoA synthetase (NDP forming)
MSESRAGNKPDLSRLLDPSAIAIVGASTNPKSISGQPLAHMLASRFEGKLYPVNPKRDEVQGVKAYPDLLSLPGQCDAAVIAVGREYVPDVLEQCGKAGIPYAVILTAGFSETHTESGTEMQHRLDAAIARSGVRVVGPNCVGVMNVIKRAYMAFGGALSDKTLSPGPLAIVSQSGGFGQSMMTFANAHGVGSNYVVSCGNEADLSFFDFAHDFLDRDEVKMIATYMEATTEGKQLRDLGRHALEVGKPILMLKVGNSGAGRRAANSHTGKLTADYTLFRTAFREGGFIEVSDLDEMADVARLVMGGKYPKGRNIGILTGSGGWGVIMADHSEKNGLNLPSTSPEHQAKLHALNSTFSSVANPIDMMANYGDQYKAIECVMDDPAFDMFLVRSAAGPDVGIWADRFIETAAKTDKPIIVNWSSIPTRDVDVREKLERAGYLCANYAGRAARAAAIFADYAIRQNWFRQGEHKVPRTVEQQSLDIKAGGGACSEQVSKACIERYGVPVTGEALLSLEAVLTLNKCPVPFPVVVKLASPDIPHKTEADAVRLSINSIADLKRAAQDVYDGGRAYAPTARIDGISIQEMASGVEVIIGAVNDPQFGPYVMVGLGGVLTEVLGDVAHRFAPVGPGTAREMLNELRGRDILNGVRGSPPVDIDALVDVIVRLSWLIKDHASVLSEVDINPLFVRPAGKGVVAADALIVPVNNSGSIESSRSKS